MRGLRALVGHPLWLQVALDAAGIALCVAAFGQIADPDVLLHGVWVVLVLEAFMFGLRVTSLRIAVATIATFAYSIGASHPASPVSSSWVTLDLEEWPLMVVIAIVVAIMADRVSTTSKHYAALYRRANTRLLTAQEDERKRLARDVHDGIGQTITAIALTLDAGESMLWSTDEPPSPQTRAALQRAQELAAMALAETRDVALRLRPARIAETGLVASIADLASRAGRPVDVRAGDDLIRPGVLPVDTEVEVYRIVQEALDNSVRHAGATDRWIEVATVDRHLQIAVGDTGPGFDLHEASQSGLGLAGMRERASAIGARLWVRTAPGHGTVVTLDVPMLPSDAWEGRTEEPIQSTSAAASR